MRVWYFLRALTVYLIIDVALRLFGYRKVFNTVVARARVRRGGSGGDAERIDRALGTVRRYYVNRKAKDCLPRALAAFYLLRREGLEPELLIGVKRFPFSAHSWVELDGKVIADQPGVAADYTPLKRMSA